MEAALKVLFDAAFAEGREIALEQSHVYAETRARLLESNEQFQSALSAVLPNEAAFVVAPADVAIGTSVLFNNKVVLTVFPAKHRPARYVIGVDDHPLAREVGLVGDEILKEDLPGAIKVVGRYLGVISTGAQIDPHWLNDGTGSQ